MIKSRQVFTNLMIFSILLAGMAGCAPAATLPAVPATPSAVLQAPTLVSGWETDNNDPNGQCGFAIDHPSDMEGASQGTYSWIWSRKTDDPGGPVPNFIYISVIPDDFQATEPGAIYNYDAGETQTLLNTQVGESKSLREDPTLAPSFTYTRLPDTTLGNQVAQAYENTQPWEFPPGTKEIRYYLKANGCTFLAGGYLSTVGSGQAGAIDEDLFGQIINTFRLQ
jgi:hypothetical protein